MRIQFRNKGNVAKLVVSAKVGRKEERWGEVVFFYLKKKHMGKECKFNGTKYGAKNI